jgi:uncharacterized protein
MKEIKKWHAIKVGMMLSLLSLSITASAQAASFECTKAATKVEKIISDNPTISALDDTLGKVYQDVVSKANAEDKQRLLTEQKHWLKYTRNVCEKETCFKHAYWSRQAELETFFQPHSPLYKHESEKTEAIKEILVTQPFRNLYSDSPKFTRLEACNQIFEALKEMQDIRFIDPIVQTQSYEDPALDPWKQQCKAEEPLHFSFSCDGHTASVYGEDDIQAWNEDLDSGCGVGYGLPPFKLFELQPLNASGKTNYVFYSDDDYGPMNEDWTKPSAGLGYVSGFDKVVVPGCKRLGSFTQARGGARNGPNYNSVFVYNNQYYLLNLYKEYGSGSFSFSTESAIEDNPNSVCRWTLTESNPGSK